MTSGQRLARLEGARTIDVGPLDTLAAYRLLEALLGAGRVNAEEQAAHELIELCDGLPLALRIVAAKLLSRPHWRIDRMVRQLLDEGRRLDELDLDGASVRATLAATYDSLEADAKRLLRRLSLAGTDDFPPWLCAPLIDTDADHADDLLHALVQAHLVETRLTEDGTVKYHLHDLVRIYAAEHLAREEPAADRLVSVRRMLSCWLFIATMAHRRIYGGDFAVLHGTAEHFPLSPDIVDGLLENPTEWFRAERSGLMAAIGRASELGLDELCWDLAVTLAAFFEVGPYREDWRASHASALSTARAASNRRGEATLLYSLGMRELGTDLVTARDYFTQSLSIFGEIAEDHGRALALAGVAFVERLEGSYDRALPDYHEAVAGFRAAGDLAGEGHALKDMAQIHMDRLDFEVAENLLDRALAICEMLGSVRLTAQVLYELAELHLRRGRLAHAADVFTSVLRRMRQSGDVVGQSYALAGLGNARRMLGDVIGAESALKTALKLTPGDADRLVRARILLTLAELDYANDRDGLALARIDKAIGLLRELGSARIWHARGLKLLGRVHYRAGRIGAAGEAWRSAMDLVSTAEPVLASQLEKELRCLPSPG